MIFENPMSGVSQMPEPTKLGKIEPWMTEFVKGRHTQEEWDAFFAYCEAGPFKRWLSRVGSFFYCILLGDR